MAMANATVVNQFLLIHITYCTTEFHKFKNIECGFPFDMYHFSLCSIRKHRAATCFFFQEKNTKKNARNHDTNYHNSQDF